MRSITVGVRRLYLAPCCSLLEGRSLRIEKPLDDTTIGVEISKEPRFGVTIVEGLRLPFIADVQLPITYKAGVKSDTTPLKGFTFTEVLCSRHVSIEDEEYDRLVANDRAAINSALRHAQKSESELEALADAVTGTIGLKLHLQFVKMLVSRELMVCDGDRCLARSFAGDALEVLNDVRVNAGTSSAIEQLLGGLAATKPESRSRVLGVMYWLTRAWTDRTPPGQLVELFMVMEILLYGIGKKDAAPSPSAALLREFIENSKSDKQDDLLAAIANLDGNRQPSLAQRFEVLAAMAKGPEGDVPAFRKFNKLRNGLVHRGDRGASTILEFKDGSIADLEDMVERYVSQSLWGDMVVYPSFHRFNRAERQVNKTP